MESGSGQGQGQGSGQGQGAGRKGKPREKEVKVAMPFPADVIRRAEVLIDVVGSRPEYAAVRVTRQMVLRMAMLEGLGAMEVRWGCGGQFAAVAPVAVAPAPALPAVAVPPPVVVAAPVVPAPVAASLPVAQPTRPPAAVVPASPGAAVAPVAVRSAVPAPVLPPAPVPSPAAPQTYPRFPGAYIQGTAFPRRYVDADGCERIVPAKIEAIWDLLDPRAMAKYGVQVAALLSAKFEDEYEVWEMMRESGGHASPEHLRDATMGAWAELREVARGEVGAGTGGAEDEMKAEVDAQGDVN